MNIRSAKKAHFVGIGGVSTSALSKLLLSYGWTVTGSDRVFSDRIVELSELGCTVWMGEDATKVGLPDVAVYTGAAKKENPEISYCRCLGIPVYERSEFLSLVAENYPSTVAVAGTHGKTTTTSYLTHLFVTAGKGVVSHIGGDAIDYGNFVKTGEDWFLTEACEYRRSLLTLRPDVGVVLNAENDHPDTYKNLSEIYDAFDAYLENSRLKIVNGDTTYYALRQKHNDAFTYGFSPENVFSAQDVRMNKNGCYGFLICEYGNPILHITLPIPGRHNVGNALCCYAVGRLSGLTAKEMEKGLSTFAGVKRRFEKKGYCFGATVISDYAHHPAEIRAAIQSAIDVRKVGGKIYVVFQPHTYSRTKRLFADFCDAFSGCDELLLCKEYAAREVPDDGMSAKELFPSIHIEKKNYFDNLLNVAAYLQKKVAPPDCILVLGAGDVNVLCDILVATN